MATLICRLAAILAGLAFQSAMADDSVPLHSAGRPFLSLLAQSEIRSLPVPPLPAAKAQPAPTNCADKSQINENFGMVTLKLTNACRRGTPVSIQVDGMKLGATFDRDGLAEVEFPLFHDHAEIVWEREDGSLAFEPVVFNGFKDAVRIALVWRSHVALALHVVEPGAAIGSTSGYLRIEKKTANGASELGAHATSLFDAEPIGNLEVYSLAAEGNPGKGLLNYYVEFVSRGSSPAGVFCGDGALAGTDFQIWILRYGALQKFDRGIAPAPCEKTLSDKVRIQRLGDISLTRD
jgi:hypothetical protein